MQKHQRDIEHKSPPHKKEDISKGEVVPDVNFCDETTGRACISSLDRYQDMSSALRWNSSTNNTGEEFDDVFIRQQTEMLRQFEDSKLSSQKISQKGETEDHLHAHGVIDQAVIEEQRRIYAEIQRQRQGGFDTRQEQNFAETTAISSKGPPLRSRIDDITKARAQTATSTDRSMPSQSEAKTASENTKRAVTEDQVLSHDRQKKIYVKGTHHVIHSIANGSAVIVHCPSCQAVLQVDKSCTTLYCVCCYQVSPLDNDSSTTTNSTMTPPMSDALAEHIVRTVQRQEIDVAAARRAAKLGRTSNGQTPR